MWKACIIIIVYIFRLLLQVIVPDGFLLEKLEGIGKYNILILSDYFDMSCEL